MKSGLGLIFLLICVIVYWFWRAGGGGPNLSIDIEKALGGGVDNRIKKARREGGNFLKDYLEHLEKVPPAFEFDLDKVPDGFCEDLAEEVFLHTREYIEKQGGDPKTDFDVRGYRENLKGAAKNLAQRMKEDGTLGPDPVKQQQGLDNPYEEIFERYF